MAKRIVLTFDGTWNTPAESFTGLRALHERFAAMRGMTTEDRLKAVETVEVPGGVETNVCRFHRSVLRLSTAEVAPGEMEQTKWYDQGVGTNWYDRVSGGAFGLGLSHKLRQGYQQLCQSYEDGDEVFILGFSRGAYTARSLVGMVRNCGLLPRDQTGAGADSMELLEAYELYRTRDKDPDSQRAKAFRAKKQARLIPIKFLGVWDTVGALGIPLSSFEEFNSEQFKFHDVELSGIVENACHAVAVDEHRKPYAATLWKPTEKTGQVMEQRWFSGAHADVGGGYEQRDLSDVTLHWMQQKAQACGLRLDPAGVPQPVVDPPGGSISDSFGAFLMGAFQLFQDRYFRPLGQLLFGAEVLDTSVGTRLAHDVAYRPKNDGLQTMLEKSRTPPPN